MLENCSPERTAQVATEILNVLNPLKTHWHATEYQVGACIGLAVATAQMANKAEWLSAADQACYAAKRAGRGQMRAASTAPESMNTRRNDCPANTGR